MATVEATPAASSPGIRLPRLVTRLMSDPMAMAAGTLVLVLILIAVFGSLVWRVNPLTQDLENPISGPSVLHPLGTDQLGRDTVARMIFGARISLQAVAIALLTAVVVGLVPGLVAGYLGGPIDLLVTRLTDALISFPPLILAIAIVGAAGPGLRNAMVAIGLILAPRLIRVIRASVLTVREEAFVEASRVIGSGTTRILVRHIFPNVISQIIVQLSNMAAFALLAEAGLSFLGLGVQAPDASWGSLLREAARYTSIAPGMFIPPGVAITLGVVALNLFGDGLRRSIGLTRTSRADLA
jgi:ABC-type dipeptide/oligopeptide/nickel transport system permease subunit